MLVSLFYPGENGGDNAHIGELFAATGVNLQNPHFSEVHVLFEHASPMCTELPGLLGRHVADLKSEDLSKLHCVDMHQRPTYADYFNYANDFLKQKVVALANTDIVFDETIGLVDGAELFNSSRVLVLGVQLPKRNGMYQKVLGQECDRKSRAVPASRCYLGKVDAAGDEDQARGGRLMGVGFSWDVYVFASPMPKPRQGEGVSGLRFFMSLNHGENAAAYAVQVEHGLAISNACLEVHAWHWHCQGTKMHAKISKDQSGKLKILHGRVLPCSDCPAVRKPPGQVRRPKQCAAGHRVPLGPALKGLFLLRPNQVEICCKEAACDQEAMLRAWRESPDALLPCRYPEDVDCYMASWLANKSAKKSAKKKKKR